MWMKSSASAVSAEGLFFASSTDEGETWSEKREMVGKPLLWGEMYGFGQSALYLIWQENSNGSLEIWGQQSLDSGITWSKPEIITSILSAPGLANTTVDIRGQIHLFYVVEKSKKNFVLQHLLWNGILWNALESAEPGRGVYQEINAVRAAVSPSGTVGVLFSAQALETSDQLRNALFFTERQLELPAGPLPSPPAPSPLPTVSPTPVIPPTQSPTPTLDLASLGPGGPGSGVIPVDPKWSGPFLGAILALIIVSFVIGYLVLARRLKGHIG